MKKVWSIVLALSLAVAARAVPARPGTFRYTQPDGSVITLRLHGDEYFHWITTADGQVVAKDADGYFRPSSISPYQKAQARQRRRMAAQLRVADGLPMTSGQRRIPVIVVSFQDLDFQIENPAEMFDRLLNEKGYSYNGATGSVRDYYYENSHGVFEPVFDVYGPVTLSHEMAYYGANENDTWKAIAEGVKLLDDQIDASRYDADGDGTVDMILMYFAGYNQAEYGPDESIWPHQSSVGKRGGLVDGKYIGRYFCTSELKGSEGAEFCAIGTTAHEFAHSLGLPDFYDTNYDEDGRSGGLYSISIMSSGNYNNDSNTPPHFNALERKMLGWMADTDIIELPEGVTEIPSIANDIAYKLSTDVTGEFFLLETRDGTRWDEPLGAQGLVIYHVDQSEHPVGGISAARQWSQWSSYNTINAYGDHPCFYVVPSGDPSALWYHYDYYYEPEQTTYEIPYDPEYMFYPGYFSVSEFTPETWDKHDQSVKLTGISFSGGKTRVELKVLGERPSEPEEGVETLHQMNFNSIDAATVYSIGEDFPLVLVEADEDRPASVSWTFDGEAASGSVVLDTAGAFVVEATLTFADGRVEVIETEIVVK